VKWSTTSRDDKVRGSRPMILAVLFPNQMMLMCVGPHSIVVE
jgi:hypothetical protein